MLGAAAIPTLREAPAMTIAGRCLVVALLAAHAVADPTIRVVIPAKEPSRPAHFNWTFTSADGRPVRTGQYACGSHWVAPADGDTGVTFVSLTGNPANTGAARDLLSVDADPLPEKHGLLSGKNHYGNYDASENLLPKLPVTLAPKPGSCISLVAAMQRNEPATSKGGTKLILGEVADAYCVVTVLPAPPPDGGKNSIRPNITGATKEFLTWDDFDLSRLPEVDFLEGRSAEEWQSVARRWRGDTEIFGMASEVQTKRNGLRFTKFSEGGRAFRAHLLVSNYGSGMARSFNDDVLAMFAKGRDLNAVKPALAAMLAFGLDIDHARYDTAGSARKRWSCGAGQSLGQFVPPVFAAALLKDPAKADRLRRVAVTNQGDDPAEVGPQELRQIHRGVTGVLLWGDGWPIVRKDNKTLVDQDWRYWADFTGSKCYDGYPGQGNPNRGKKTATDPYGYIDGPANQPGSAYMGVAFGGFRAMAAIMLLMPDFRRVVNSDDPVEYVDRVVRHGLWTWPDPVASPSATDRETAAPWWSPKGCKEWGRTWGPNLDDVRFAIENGIDDDQGRFKSLHGRKYDKAGYESAQAVRNWPKLIALYDGPTFEDRAVPLGTTVAPEILFAPGDAGSLEAHLRCATPDAVVRYTLDGAAPTADSPTWQGKPIPVKPGTVVNAVAETPRKKPSAVRARTAPPR